MDKEKQYGFINKHNRDYYGGGLMLLLGLGAIWEGMSYRIGTLVRMGPGFFPVALGVILALAGVAIMIGAAASAAAETAAEAEAGKEEKNLPPEWRGWICISLSIVAFVIFGEYGGLVPATFAVVFISALGDRQNTVKGACILAIVMCFLCIAIFWYGLQVQFPLFQWGGR